MRCWNCGRPLPQAAKNCERCEAPVEPEPTAGEMEAARALLDQLPPDLTAELEQIFTESATAEEFANRIMVGNCPKCDSANTADCEADPEIEELLVGRCYDCGQFWCTECCRLLKPKALTCPCWEEDDLPEEADMAEE